MTVFSHQSSSSFQALVKALPNALLRQYEYEDPKIKDGKHLMHSPYFKVLCVPLSAVIGVLFWFCLITLKRSLKHYCRSLGLFLQLKEERWFYAGF